MPMRARCWVVIFCAMAGIAFGFQLPSPFPTATRRTLFHTIKSLQSIQGENKGLEELPLPPGELGLPIFGDQTMKFAKQGSTYLATMHDKWGDIYMQRLLFTKAIVVTGLDNLKKLWLSEHDLVEAEVPSVYAALLGEKGIFMTKGDAHTKLKQQLSRGFSPAAINGYLPSMQSLTEQFCEKWAQQRTIQGVDAAKDLSFGIILDVVMGFDRSIWSDDANAGRIRKLYATVQNAMLAPPINLPGTPFRKALRAREELLVEIERSIQRVAADRGPSEEGKARNVAAILLQATDNEGNRLSLEQMKEVSFNMLDAGQDTTGLTLASILLSLTQEPTALAALRAEHAGILAAHGTTITPAALRDMVYTEAVIKEALRNASPAPAGGDRRMRSITVINVKKALRDFEIGGYRVPAGTTVIGNIARAVQNDPRWEGLEDTPQDKRRFCPARWLSTVTATTNLAAAGSDSGSRSAPRPSDSSSPNANVGNVGPGGGAFSPFFAAGPRACLGAALAVAELKVALAVLARGYEWRRAGPGGEEVPAAEPVAWKSDPFPYPLDRLPLIFTRRSET